MDGLWFFLIYILIISTFACFVTIHDKRLAVYNGEAVRKKRRVPERTLLIIAAMGGSAAMYLTMKKIRHKTQHAKFMVGLPAIFMVQVVLLVLLVIIC